MTRLTEAPETDGNSTRRATQSLDDLVHRAEAEYREMPGLSLTARQAERLWGLDRATCGVVLTTLTERQILKRTRTGTYLRGPAAASGS